MAINGQSVLAVIPARGGSKRCPRKNVRPFMGKPLLVWSIEAAHQSKYIDCLIFSSDDEEMLKVASDYCSISKRPSELAADDSSNEDVLRYYLRQRPLDWVVLLQPTSPLRTAADIDACIERAQMGDGCITYNEETFQKSGAVYVARREWIEKHDFSHAGLMKLNMPASRSLDIDYPEQFDG